MNLDALAEKLAIKLYTKPDNWPDEIRAALAQVRDEALEEAAKWHDTQEKESERLKVELLKRGREADAMDTYRVEICHNTSAAAIRAMKGEPR